MTAYIWKYLLPGLGLYFLAFLFGSQKNALFGFLSFIAFFTGGTALVIEGWKRRNHSDKSSKNSEE